MFDFMMFSWYGKEEKLHEDGDSVTFQFTVRLVRLNPQKSTSIPRRGGTEGRGFQSMSWVDMGKPHMPIMFTSCPSLSENVHN